MVCCFVASLLLPRPRSIRRGQKHRLVRRDAPLLLLLAAWLGVCSAAGTICAGQPSVCSGTFSGSLLRLETIYPEYSGMLDGSLPSQLGLLTALDDVDLDLNYLSGSLPTQLGALTLLTELDLSANSLSGSLPTQLAALTAMKDLTLDLNRRLSGSVPTQLAALTALEHLYLQGNALSGSLPTQLGTLTALRMLAGGDKLSGSLPTQLGTLTALSTLGLDNDELSGSLPTELGTLTALESVYLDANKLSGSLPTQLGTLPALRLLGVEQNELSGSLPTQLGALPLIWQILLDSNELSGSLPTQLATIPMLHQLQARANKLSGSLPTQLGAFGYLVKIALGANRLSGSLPTQLGALAVLQELSLPTNKLSGSLPTQLGALTGPTSNTTFPGTETAEWQFFFSQFGKQVKSMSLDLLRLEENELSGSLPTQLGALTTLDLVRLEENELSGSLPTQFGALNPIMEACNLGGTNNLACPATVEIIPSLCAASLQCISLVSNSSGAALSELSPGPVLLWVLLPLGMLLLVGLVLLGRLYSRISRDRTNLRLSRDRANLDLQLLSHQVQRARTEPNDTASQPDAQSERRCASGATVVSFPPGPPSSSGASTAAAALPPTAPTTGPTSSSNGKANGKRKAEARPVEVPLSWAEADQQFYASAAGRAYLAAATTTAPSSSAAPAPAVVRSSATHSERAGTQLAEVPLAQLVPDGVSPALPSTVLSDTVSDSPAPPEPAPAPLRRTAAPRKFTSKAPGIHRLIPERTQDVWDRHVGRRWHTLPDAERTQRARNEAPSSSSVPSPASATAPSAPSAPDESSAVNLKDLALLTDLPDEEAFAALANHLFDLRRAVRPPILPSAGAAPTPLEPSISVETDPQRHVESDGAPRAAPSSTPTMPE